MARMERVKGGILWFKVLRAVVMKGSVSWIVTPCGLLKGNWRFRGTSHLRHLSMRCIQRGTEWKCVQFLVHEGAHNTLQQKYFIVVMLRSYAEKWSVRKSEVTSCTEWNSRTLWYVWLRKFVHCFNLVTYNLPYSGLRLWSKHSSSYANHQQWRATREVSYMLGHLGYQAAGDTRVLPAHVLFFLPARVV
jgi:hypothetical protein